MNIIKDINGNSNKSIDYILQCYVQRSTLGRLISSY